MKHFVACNFSTISYSTLSSQPDQLVIEGLVNKMEARISRLNRLWENRHTRLEQSKQVIEFEQEVPKVIVT